MEENRRTFFDRLADNWDDFNRVPDARYRRIVKETLLEKHHKILDVGTGTGVMIPYILEAAGRDAEVFALDYSEKMIEKLRGKKFPDNVRFFVMDIQSTNFKEDFFDRIIVNSCYPHFEEKPAALREIYRILKKEGILTISHPTGREQVNSLHKTYSLIENDIIDGIVEMKESVESCGFKFLKGIDEEKFFLISFIK